MRRIASVHRTRQYLISGALNHAIIPIVRQAQPKDQADLAQWYLCNLANAPWLPAGHRPPGFDAATEGERVYLCESSRGELMGFVSVFAPESFIHHLHVAPAYQRHGVGSALLASLAAWLPPPWSLKCVEANTEALTFHAATGWIEQARAQGPEGPHLLLTIGAG